MPEKILEDSEEINGTPSDMQPGIDPVFKHWALDYRPFLRKLRRGALWYNHKLLRLLIFFIQESGSLSSGISRTKRRD
jgi:hypothetical protein